MNISNSFKSCKIPSILNSLAHKYHSRAEFLHDIQLIASNCEQYNGPESELTKDARILVEFTKGALDEVRFLQKKTLLN